MRLPVYPDQTGKAMNRKILCRDTEALRDSLNHMKNTISESTE